MATEAVLPIGDLCPSSSPVRLKVALLGFGTVGRSVAGILQKQRFAGLELTHIFNRSIARKRAGWTDSAVCWTESIDDVLAAQSDVVVEVVGGVEPARTWVRAALESGKSVVTANKQLIARHGTELLDLAQRNGCRLLYGASVAGVVPVIAAFEHGLAGDSIESISGILNGTCNYILSQMEQGSSFEVALKRAQDLGYAEADPTDDVEGFDARAKLVILARVGLGIDLDLDSVGCSSIRSVKALDFQYARELGCTIRQVAHGELTHGKTFAAVEPALVSQDSHLGRARDCENVLVARGHFGGDIIFAGAGAGGDATAVAVISDLLSLSEARNGNSFARPLTRCRADQNSVAARYLRFVVKDRPGIVGQIASALAKQGINVDAVLQKPGYERNELPFVITVEPCNSAKLRAAEEEIATFEFLAEPPLMLRMHK